MCGVGQWRTRQERLAALVRGGFSVAVIHKKNKKGKEIGEETVVRARGSWPPQGVRVHGWLSGCVTEKRQRGEGAEFEVGASC